MDVTHKIQVAQYEMTSKHHKIRVHADTTLQLPARVMACEEKPFWQSIAAFHQTLILNYLLIPRDSMA